MTDMPLPRQSVNSSRACSSTSTGSAAGPGAKLNTRTQQPLTAHRSQRADLVAAAVAERTALVTARGAVRVLVVAFTVDRCAVVAGFQAGDTLHAGQALGLAQSDQALSLDGAGDHRDVGYRRTHQGAG